LLQMLLQWGHHCPRTHSSFMNNLLPIILGYMLLFLIFMMNSVHVPVLAPESYFHDVV
jgi:hypothetical protein